MKRHSGMRKNIGVTWLLPLSVINVLLAIVALSEPGLRGFGAIDGDCGTWDSRTAAGPAASAMPRTCLEFGKHLSATR